MEIRESIDGQFDGIERRTLAQVVDDGEQGDAARLTDVGAKATDQHVVNGK